ncbi:hypothetical protein HPB52_001475 [Rhipicephalus sanguineus]|uniref:Gustatory receptor n=1 Tax=Rhipicephalus sanguineus TaxID=34632 RepID=A0A9D4PEC5_RHISA|nr:hypothetical protein HPB52_001475 [Rhipicephalus sanguineus]
MSSFMRRHFKWYGMICKSSGLLILHSSKTSESDEEVFSWSKLYLIYSVACLSVCAFVELGYFYQVWLAVLVHDLVFTTTIYILLYVFVAAKAALNATLTSYLSLEFVDQLGCGTALGAIFKLTCIAGDFLFYVIDAASFLVIRPCCEVIRLYIDHQHGVLRSIVLSGGSDVVGADKRARLVERVRLNICTVSQIKRSLNEIWEYAIAASGVMVLYTSCAGIYLNFAEEFWTLEHVLAILYTISTVLDFLDIAILSDEMVRERQTDPDDPHIVVGMGTWRDLLYPAICLFARLNLCAVMHLKRSLNAIWEYAIATTGIVALFASCGGIYLNFIEEFWTLENLLVFLYTVSTALDILDIAILSDAMVTEVLYLSDSLKPGEMALSGAGFFSLKLPMLVSLAGAVITYTVILVQTSESVKNG